MSASLWQGLRHEQSIPTQYQQEKLNMSRMHNPPHPGATLREGARPALGLTVTDAAKQLGVPRTALSCVLNERTAISPEMAPRLKVG